MIDAEKANYTISRMCRLLKVDRRRYYEWCRRQAAGRTRAEQRRAELTSKIVEFHKASDGGCQMVCVGGVPDSRE